MQREAEVMRPRKRLSAYIKAQWGPMAEGIKVIRPRAVYGGRNQSGPRSKQVNTQGRLGELPTARSLAHLTVTSQRRRAKESTAPGQ